MTRPLPWSEAFAVGHKGLDAEHRRLVDIINEVSSALEANLGARQIRTLLDALEIATADHFKHEDAVLRDLSARMEADRHPTAAYRKAVSDAALEDHIAEHKRALDNLKSITASAARTEGRPAGWEPCAELKGWFIEHAVKYDARLKAVFQAVWG